MKRFLERCLLFLERFVGAGILFLLGSTWRFRVSGTPPPGTRCIYTFWHRNILPLAFSRRGEEIVVMISSSRDGELIAGPVEVLGFQTTRGSSTRGGSKAVRELIRLSRKHSIVIVPDGPKGPSMRMKPGVVHIARYTGLPVVPVGVDIESEWTLRSWDRFRIPKPFSRIRVIYGDPVMIDPQADARQSWVLLQKKMEELTENAHFDKQT